jgi:hypothetical protein
VYRSRGRPSEGLNLVKTGDLILSEVKYPSATGQIEALRHNRPPLAERISRITQRHRAKEGMPERPRDELLERIVQQRSGQHDTDFSEADESLRGETALDFREQVSDFGNLATQNEITR